MNLVTSRIIGCTQRGDYERVDALIDGYATLIGTGAPSIRWYRVGDDVLCVLSRTQVQFSGYLSKHPHWSAPAHMTPVEGHA